MPKGYYVLSAPDLLRGDPRRLSATRRAELDKFAIACRTNPEMSGVVGELFDALMPRSKGAQSGDEALETMLAENGFDPQAHEQIRRGYESGPHRPRAEPSAGEHGNRGCTRGATCAISNATRSKHAEWERLGMEALKNGEVAVLSLAAGSASRWTQGAGVVKALHPFCKIGGRHRTFIEIHLAKSRRICRIAGTPLPHIFTTSHLTHQPVSRFLERCGSYGYPRARDSFAGPFHWLAARADAAGPAFRVGGNAATGARRAAAEGPRQPAECAYPMGCRSRGRLRLQGQSASPMPAPGRALV